MKVIDIYNAINEAAPFDTALDFDNSGFLVGAGEQELTKVLLALDITLPVVAEAKALGAQLIVSHHPVIFDPVKKLMAGTALYELAKNDIAAICAHTNVDLSPDIGTNRALASLLELDNFRPEGECLFSGELPREMSPKELAEYIAEKLGAPYITFTKAEKKISKLCFCSGSGGDFVFEVAGKCDAYLTGEAKHHELLFAAERGLPMFVAGHYATERPFVHIMKNYLSEKLRNVEFLISEAESAPVTHI